MKLNKEQIKEIKELTHYNNHTLARLEIARALRSNTHIKFYQAINDLHLIYGHMPSELSIVELVRRKRIKLLNILRYEKSCSDYVNAEKTTNEINLCSKTLVTLQKI